MSAIEYLMSRTEADPFGGCLLWNGPQDSGGYGQGKIRGRRFLVHRESWIEQNGPIPDGFHVLHRCDVRCCINRDHLFLGTHAENMEDKTVKGRAAKPSARLSRDDVLAIRTSTAKPADLARRFSISRRHAADIQAGKYWGDLTALLSARRGK